MASDVNGPARPAPGNVFVTFIARVENYKKPPITNPIDSAKLNSHTQGSFENRTQTGAVKPAPKVGKLESVETWVTFEVPKTVAKEKFTILLGRQSWIYAPEDVQW